MGDNASIFYSPILLFGRIEGEDKTSGIMVCAGTGQGFCVVLPGGIANIRSEIIAGDGITSDVYIYIKR